MTLSSHSTRTIALIRHGKTEANLRGAYLGRGNPPLCPLGVRELSRCRPFPAERVISSPLLRCLETAALLYPDQAPVVLRDLQERDFGELEGLTHEEIIRLPGMERWGMDASRMPFPGGEEEEAFGRRCLRAFDQLLELMEREQTGTAAVIAHGGVLMAILSGLFPRSSFYDWRADCGSGWLLTQTGRQFGVQALPPEGG